MLELNLKQKNKILLFITLFILLLIFSISKYNAYKAEKNTEKLKNEFQIKTAQTTKILEKKQRFVYPKIINKNKINNNEIPKELKILMHPEGYNIETYNIYLENNGVGYEIQYQINKQFYDAFNEFLEKFRRISNLEIVNWARSNNVGIIELSYKDSSNFWIIKLKLLTTDINLTINTIEILVFPGNNKNNE
jgi:hypothetical protein